jgi:PIN domain nuclease of toxin-antitoxin system
MRTLEVGTWLQLTSESGRIEPAKVSWISPISARLLFVNRRGIRVLVASAEELAAMARLGKLQLREADNAFEDAMHQMLGRLQSSAVSG